MTAHFIDPDDFEQKLFTLATKFFPDSHSGINICDILSELLEEWNILKSKVHLLLRDNAANMALGARLLDIPNLACFIHTLQLVINDAILSQRSVIDMLAKSRSIVGHFAHSASACQMLSDIQEKLDLPKYKLIQDVPTRWNSTLNMLERVYEQRQALTSYGADHNIPVMNNYTYTLMSNVIRVLQPFEELTKMASSDKESVSSIIPSVETMKSYLKKSGKDHGIQTLKNSLLEAVEKRFSDGGNIPLTHPSLEKATYLDPRYKLKFLSPSTGEKVRKDLIEELLDGESQVEEEANDISDRQDNILYIIHTLLHMQNMSLGSYLPLPHLLFHIN